MLETRTCLSNETSRTYWFFTDVTYSSYQCFEYVCLHKVALMTALPWIGLPKLLQFWGVAQHLRQTERPAVWSCWWQHRGRQCLRQAAHLLPHQALSGVGSRWLSQGRRVSQPELQRYTGQSPCSWSSSPVLKCIVKVATGDYKVK